MIRRRFVNLVAYNYSTGERSLHRLDAAKHLFYPSTAKAEAAHAKEEDNNGGNPKPSKIGSLRRLPLPSLRFETFATASNNNMDMDDESMVLLNHHSSEGKILHASDDGEDGWAVLYDADSGSATTMPDIEGPLGSEPTFISVAGAGKEEGSLYVMTNHYWQHGFQFQVLHFGQCPLKWEPLPLPPFASSSSSSTVRSYTVVDGGRTICASIESKGTYCFDTRSHQWHKAGDWVLPFQGRAEYVSELDTWFGIQPYNDHLCASSDLATAMADHREPTLQHVWKYLDLPNELEYIVLKGRLRGICLRRSRNWSLDTVDLLNLGGGRFCIATVIQDQRTVSFGYESDTETEAEFVVLSGLEVVRDAGNREEGGLRMVKHKSKRYMFGSNKIQWVL
ncbi:unnamed protein product [Urochloa decumbens]|uniref:Uncharacterized protein n=1 Tax=Urochloa decumbens TaxID=240449 RepID=A0ABC9GAQ4_9POAL